MFLLASLTRRIYIRHEWDRMGIYILEVKAKFDAGSPNNKAEQLANDIVLRILNVYRNETHDEQIIRENRFSSPLFHRLYTNLVDKDNTLEKKVEELRKEYSPHSASFLLTPQVG